MEKQREELHLQNVTKKRICATAGGQFPVEIQVADMKDILSRSIGIGGVIKCKRVLSGGG